MNGECFCIATQIREQEEELKNIKTQNALMKEALEYYANTSHWHVQSIDRDTENIMENFSGQMQMITVGGKRARKALAEVKLC